MIIDPIAGTSGVVVSLLATMSEVPADQGRVLKSLPIESELTLDEYTDWIVQTVVDFLKWTGALEAVMNAIIENPAEDPKIAEVRKAAREKTVYRREQRRASTFGEGGPGRRKTQIVFTAQEVQSTSDSECPSSPQFLSPNTAQVRHEPVKNQRTTFLAGSMV